MTPAPVPNTLVTAAPASTVSGAAALTSIWTPPCWTTDPDHTDVPKYPVFSATVTDNFVNPNSIDAAGYSCNPPSYFKYAGTPAPFAGYNTAPAGYYSPAICPSGFKPACTRWDDEQGPKPQATQTAVMCCPDGYQCWQKSWNTRVIGANDRISSCYYTSTRKPDWTQYMGAPMIQIRWQSDDLKAFETPPLRDAPSALLSQLGISVSTSTASDGSTTVISSTGTPAPSSTSGTSDSNDGQSGDGGSSGGGGLSPAAKAGIGIGVVVFVAFFILGALLFWRRRRLREHTQVATDPSTSDRRPLTPMPMIEKGNKESLLAGARSSQPPAPPPRISLNPFDTEHPETQDVTAAGNIKGMIKPSPIDERLAVESTESLMTINASRISKTASGSRFIEHTKDMNS